MNVSNWVEFEGIKVRFVDTGKGRIYREAYTKAGNLLDKNFVYGLTSKPYVRAYNRKLGICSEELQALSEIA